MARPVFSEASRIASASFGSVTVWTSVASKPTSRARRKRSTTGSSFGSIDTSTALRNPVAGGMPAAARDALPTVSPAAIAPVAVVRNVRRVVVTSKLPSH
jgi:hypothetical protein